MKRLKCEYKTRATDVRLTRITQDVEVKRIRWKRESGVPRVVVNVCVSVAFRPR